VTLPRTRVAVVGVGHLGTRHAERLAASDRWQLTAVHDLDPERREALAARLGTRAAATLDEALEPAEAVVVATSTPSHHGVALAALDAGRHVLVEKPLTDRLDTATALVQVARSRRRVLHVGHIERFNPAVRGLWKRLPPPLFIESHRLAPLTPRNLDIDVVQDLMVHDVDLTLGFVGEEPSTVDAVGVSVLTGLVDIANARLRFPGGTVANLTASRVSTGRVRKFRMFLPGAYVSADCAEGTGAIIRLRRDAAAASLPPGEPVNMEHYVDREKLGDSGPDALTLEHEAFSRAIQGEPHLGVGGEDALCTLRVLGRIQAGILEGLRGPA
jgi:predicted dehydrogenase